MPLPRTSVIGGVLVLAVFGITTTGAQAQSGTRCVAIDHGVEYRAYLPDGKRYVYVDVRVLSGIEPSVFVIIDKNYDSNDTVPVKNDPYAAWWIDRSHPMGFSTDRIKVRWPDDSTWQTVTGWLSGPDWQKTVQTIPGLEAAGKGFIGTGSNNANTYAFQTRIDMPGFNSDEFDVTLPAVTFDGVTVAPPMVHFQRTDDSLSAKC